MLNQNSVNISIRYFYKTRFNSILPSAFSFLSGLFLSDFLTYSSSWLMLLPFKYKCLTIFLTPSALQKGMAETSLILHNSYYNTGQWTAVRAQPAIFEGRLHYCKIIIEEQLALHVVVITANSFINTKTHVCLSLWLASLQPVCLSVCLSVFCKNSKIPGQTIMTHYTGEFY